MKSKVDSFDSGITENNSGSHLTSDSAEIQSLSTSHGGSVPLAVDCQSTHSPSCYELQAPSMSVVICTLQTTRQGYCKVATSHRRSGFVCAADANSGPCRTSRPGQRA
jgi:hypothetical protein